ncbi:hypothetical protein AB3K25_02590 [Leuconostoc sp. MS02]|uniref:Uncharacterized protein n=1 Tax=Leuconostoc aquikimchii TaxID=3236804 RepID=A0ABV3S551_9LACO
MVAINSNVIINIQSKSQEERLRKTLRPSKSDIESPEFNQKVSEIADGFIASQKGMARLKRFLQ